MNPLGFVRAAGALAVALLSTYLCLSGFGLAQPAKTPTTQDTLGAAYRQRDQNKLPEAIATCEQVLVIAGATPQQKQEALEILIDVYRRQKEPEKALAAAARMGQVQAGWPAGVARSSVLQGELTFELKRPDQALAHFAAAIARSEDPHQRQYCLARSGAILAAAERHAEALAMYERVFTDAPTITDYWYEAQRNLVELLRKLKRDPEALQAARICLDAAGDPGNISANTQLLAAILKDIDGNVTRANALLEFQQFGPAGKDGQSGTADDLANPLTAVGYPAYPQRESAFAKARAEAGDDFAASRLRALTYLYTGHPPETLQHLAESFRRRQGQPHEMQSAVQELIAIGVRAVRGHAVDLDRFYDFVRLGPDGPDGQAGTADDLKDPFAEVGLPPRAPSDDGGLVPLPAAERKILVDMRSMLQTLAQAEHDDMQWCNELLVSLQVVHNILCDWGGKGQEEWYTKLLLEGTVNQYVQLTLAWGGQSAARGNDLHFASARRFWRELDAAAQGDNRTFPNEVQQVRNGLEQTLKLLEKPPLLVPKIAPMK